MNFVLNEVVLRPWIWFSDHKQYGEILNLSIGSLSYTNAAFWVAILNWFQQTKQLKKWTLQWKDTIWLEIASGLKEMITKKVYPDELE